VAGRASTVGAAVTHVGKVRDHNEDAHFIDPEAGLFIVCDGMGGHAAGEVASDLAVRTIRGRWMDGEVRRLADAWLAEGTAEARKRLFGALRAGVIAAHDQILAEGAEDDAKSGMGTTLVGAMVIGDELVFAHAGDSRAYLVRDGIAMQLTEDHTLLARLLAAGIDVDVSGEGARFRSMLTNALGIGQECKVSTFVVPLADGDRFLLCSDGVSEYVPEVEVGTVLTKQATPARAAERLIELALERGGGDNATALVIRVNEAGEKRQSAEHRRLDDEAVQRCPLWGAKVTPQQRLRALRIAIPRDHGAGERIPAHTLGDRVAWIVLEGALSYRGKELGPGALIYPESLVSDAPGPERDALAVARSDVRALALRADDFRELCDDDSELGEALLETLGTLISGPRRPGRTTRSHERPDTELERRPPSNSDVIEPPPPVLAPLPIAVRPASSPPAAGGRPGSHPPPAAAARPGSHPPSRGSDPKLPRPPTPAPVPGLLQRPRSTPPQAIPVPIDSTERDDDEELDDLDEDGLDSTEARPSSHDDAVDEDDDGDDGDDGDTVLHDQDPATSPRIRRAPSEPEIETFYEVDAEPPPLPAPDVTDDDDAFEEMIVSVDDESGRITAKVTETNDAVVFLTLADESDEAPGASDDDPTEARPLTAGDGDSVSGTISIPDLDTPTPVSVASSPALPPSSSPPSRPRRSK